MNLTDVYHYTGADLFPSSTGDLLGATTTVRGQQRILRRLLTNPGDYIFHPGYGAGLPSFIGQTDSLAKIKAVIRSQIMLEDAVARFPDPVITVAAIGARGGGGIAISIRYTDAPSGQPVALNFQVSK